MPIDRKAYKAAKKEYKGKVKANKKIVKSNKKIDRKSEADDKAHDKMVNRADKKYEKSEARANKKDHKKRVAAGKRNRAKEKKEGLEPGSIVGGQPPRRPSPKPMFAQDQRMMKSLQSPTGPKPKRSDYKGGEPQKATGSASSMVRMKEMVHRPVNNPILRKPGMEAKTKIKK
tara:strand:- start:541 stop:1059 length:519 start_codon:yes stop_codon:yes gene_type:complete